MKNSGNELKKYFKTKDIAIFRAAFFAHFACNFAPIGPRNEQKRQDLRKTKRSLWLGKREQKETYCRLVGAVRELPCTLRGDHRS